MGAPKISSINEVELSRLFTSYWKYISEASFNAEYFCENLSTSDFIRFASLRNHKSRGSDVENRIRIKNGWTRLKRSAEAGDLIDLNGKNVEVKSSIVTPNNGSRVTLRGFRTWEKVDYYLAVVLDVSDYNEEPKVHIYQFAPDAVKSDSRFTPDVHSKKARVGNANVSLGISFSVGDPTFVSWEKYRTKLVRF
jgi:hypothetical protein